MHNHTVELNFGGGDSLHGEFVHLYEQILL